MSLLAKEITAQLTESVEHADPAILRRAFDRLCLVSEKALVLGPTHHASHISPDLYLFVAEAALALPGQWAIATHCVNRLQEEGCVSTPVYAVRSLYARAAVQRHESEGLRGPELVVGVKASLALVVHGMKLALADPFSMAHLVEAGAAHLWNAARMLYHGGTFGDCAPALAFAVQALEKVELADAKARVVWYARLATAYAGGDRPNEAVATAQKAADLAAKSAPQLRYMCFRMQCGLQLAAANPKLKADAKGALRGIYAAHSVLCGAVDEATGEPDIVAAIQELAAELAKDTAAGADDNDKAAGGKAGGGKGASPNAGNKGAGKGADAAASAPGAAELDAAVREETYAELGFAAAFCGNAKVAAEVANRAAVSKRLAARVYADYAKALVTATQCGGIELQDQTDFSQCTPETAHELLGAIRRVDRALESALRVPEATERNFLVQQGAILVWNLALPLLQSSTRALVAKCLSNAAKALDETGSNLALLRAQLHLEAATADADAQLATKAAARVELALAIDYAAPAEHVKLYSLPKPLDRYLKWLQRCLAVKTQVYDQPESPEDEAMAIIEQAADAQPGSRQSMLTRAFSVMEGSEPASDFFNEASATEDEAAPGSPTAAAGGAKKPAAKAAAPKGGKGAAAAAEASTNGAAAADENAKELESRRQLMRSRTLLWSRLLTLGWEARSPSFLPTCRAAAERVTCRSWTRRGDRDMRTLQARAFMALAEMAAFELKRAGITVGQKTFLLAAANNNGGGTNAAAAGGATGTSDDSVDAAAVEAAAAKAQQCAALQADILKHVASASDVGTALVGQQWPDQYLVCDAATALWNYFLPAFKQGDFHAALPALETIWPAVDALNLSPAKEVALLTDTALAFARALVQRYIKESLGLSDSLDDQVTLQETAIETFTKTDAANPHLAKAGDVCERMIALLPTPMEAYRFVGLCAIVRRLQGRPVDVRADPQLKVITAVEQCGLNLPAEEMRGIIAATPPLLAQDPNVELCARLAERCLTVPGCERIAVRVCAIGQGLYTGGKLGLRRAAPAAVPSSAPAAAGGKGAPAKTDKKAAAAAAVEAAEAAAEVPPPPPTDDDWTWYALLLQYQAIAVAGLMDPTLQDKATQNEIRRQCLTALTNSAVAATRAVPERKTPIIVKAVRLFAHISADLAGHASTRAIALPALKILLSNNIVAHLASAVNARPGAAAKQASANNAVDSNAGLTTVDAAARLFLLLVSAHRDANHVDAGLSAMKAALKVLPASHHRPFWDIDVQLRCQAGLPLNQTLLRVKEYDPETQARVWMALARHSPDRKNQLFGLQNAIQVLEPRPAEKAAHLIALAQWMVATNYACGLDDVRTVLLTAIDTVADRIDESFAAFFAATGGGDGEGGSAYGGDGASVAGGSAPTGTRSRLTHRSHGDASSVTRSSTRQGGLTSSRAGGTLSKASAGTEEGHPAVAVPACVKELTVAIEAYYMLARIGGSDEAPAAAPAAAAGGAATDSRSNLMAASRYVLRLWDACASAAAQHVHAQRVKAQQAEARKAQMNAAAAAAGGHGSKADMGKSGRGKPGRASSIAGQALAPEPSLSSGAAAAGGKVEGLTKQDLEAFSLPADTAGWLTYHPSAELVTALRATSLATPDLVPSAATVQSPHAFLAVLGGLAQQLSRAALPLAAMAALAMQGTLSQVLLTPGPFAAAAVNAAQLAGYQTALHSGAEAAAAAHRVLNPVTPAADQAALLEDARVEAQRIAARHADPTSSIMAAAPGTAAVRDAAPSFGVQLSTAAVSLRDPSTHAFTLWVEMAAALIDEGRLSMASRLLSDASAHAPKYGDVFTESRIHFLHSRVLKLQGYPQKALDAVRHARQLARASVPIDDLLELATAEASLLLQLGEVDSAFALEREVQSALSAQLTTRTGLHRAIAAATVPARQADFAVRFAGCVVAAYQERIDSDCRPPRALLERLRGTVTAAVDRALAGFDANSGATPPPARGSSSTAAAPKRPSCANPATACPSRVAWMLAQMERLQLQVAGAAATLAARKTAAHREAVRLEHCIAELQASLAAQLETCDLDAAAPRTDTHRLLGSALLRLAESKMAAVRIRRAALAAYRGGNATVQDFPRVPGASMDTDVTPKLEAKIVAFMRSTKKQREAAVKRERLAQRRADVDEARRAARAEKQAAIDAQREARKQEEAAALAASTAAGAPAKKDTKAAGKAGKGGANPAASVIEDPDVDPNDKCGIQSPPCSEDDGSAEDSTSESDEEMCYAIQTSTSTSNTNNNSNNAATDAKEDGKKAIDRLGADDRFIAKATLSDVLELAARAEEMLGGAAAAGDDGVRARVLAAAANRMIADDATMGLEGRRAVLQGNEVAPLVAPFFESDTLHTRWSSPIDTAAEEAENAAAAAAAAPKKGGAAPAPKKSGKGSVAPPPTSPTPDLTGRVSGVERTQLAPKPRLAQLALATSYAAAATSYRLAFPAALTDALFECAQCAMAAGYPHGTVAGHIAAAHAASMEGQLLKLWLAAAPPECAEAATVRALLALKDEHQHAPGAARTALYASAVKSTYKQSKFLQRIRLPEGAIAAQLPTANATDALGGAAPGSVPPLAPLPADVAVLTLHLREGGSQIFAALHRGARDGDVRRCGVADGAIPQLTAAASRYATIKRATLSSNATAAAAASAGGDDDSEAIELEFAGLVRALTSVLSPITDGFKPLLEGNASKTHLVICADAALQPFPLEAVAGLSAFKSVSRDISLFAVQTRLARRAADKYTAAAASFVVDPMHDAAGSFAAALFAGEDKPKQAQWSVATATVDGQSVRPVPESSVQRALLQPANNAATAVVACCGTLPNALPLAGLAAAELSHLRVAAVLDNAVTASSVRRENQAAMSKPAALRHAEQPWNVGLLLLARGVDCCVTNTVPVSVSVAEVQMRLVAGTLEKPQMRNVAEIIRSHLHRTLPVLNPDTDALSMQRAATVVTPADGDVYQCWTLPASDRLALMVFGVSPDDGTAPPTKGGK